MGGICHELLPCKPLHHGASLSNSAQKPSGLHTTVFLVECIEGSGVLTDTESSRGGGATLALVEPLRRRHHPWGREPHPTLREDLPRRHKGRVGLHWGDDVRLLPPEQQPQHAGGLQPPTARDARVHVLQEVVQMACNGEYNSSILDYG